jgi:RimJ/RimL family protein N-acetyltransferase
VDPDLIIGEVVSDSDIEQVLDVHSRGWLNTYPSPEHGVALETVQEMVQAKREAAEHQKSVQLYQRILKDETCWLRVVRKDNIICGVAYADKGEPFQTLSIYLDPELQGKGVADTLMMQAKQWLNDRTIEIEVVSYNQRAISFYERFGFKVIPDSTRIHRGYLPVITMRTT